MKIKGFRGFPKWNRKVTSPKWSRIILRSFRATLFSKSTVLKKLENPGSSIQYFPEIIKRISRFCRRASFKNTISEVMGIAQNKMFLKLYWFSWIHVNTYTDPKLKIIGLGVPFIEKGNNFQLLKFRPLWLQNVHCIDLKDLDPIFKVFRNLLTGLQDLPARVFSVFRLSTFRDFQKYDSPKGFGIFLIVRSNCPCSKFKIISLGVMDTSTRSGNYEN